MSVFLDEKVFNRKETILSKAEVEADKIVSDIKKGIVNTDAIDKLCSVFEKRFNLSKFKLKLSKDKRWINKRKKNKNKEKNNSKGQFYTKFDIGVVLESLLSENKFSLFEINEDYSFVNKKHKITVYSDYESISGLENGSQLIVIILHEIGHHYYELSVSMMIGYMLGGVYNIFLTVVTIPLNILESIISYFIQLLNSILFDSISKSLSFIFLSPIKILVEILKLPLTGTLLVVSQSHKQEEFADYFVSVNGYGSLLGSVFLDFYKDREKDPNTNIYLKSLNTIDELSLLMFSVFYVHPELSVRVKNQISNLEHELNYATTDDEKEFIKNEIKTLKRVEDSIDNEKLKTKLLNLSPINSYIETAKSKTIFYGSNFEDLRSRIVTKK